MSESPAIAPGESRHARWWLEYEVGLLVLLVLGTYFLRMTDLTIRGEESRRGRIAWEMIDSGDWLVPRVQGEPRLTRPPLQYWTIALVGLARGGVVDAVAIRLPSVAAILLTVLLVYGYGRTFLSRVGAFAAAAGFATMGQVLELGRLGETEALFTLLLAGAMLVWHWGYTRGWPAAATWCVSYLLMGLATLAKGPQGPVYFVGGVGLILMIERRWRFAVSWSHAAGILLCLALLGAWQIPFHLAQGADDVSTVYLVEVGKRFGDTSIAAIAKHLGKYPVEILFGCLMPWSILLTAYLRRDFCEAARPLRSHVLFLAGCIAVAFPTVWFPPQSRTRYFMPLYPHFALLAGVVIDRVFAAAQQTEWTKVWTRYARGVALVILLAGGAVLGASVVRPASEIAQPMAVAICYAGAAIVIGAVLFWSSRELTPRHGRLGVLAIAAFLGLSYSGPVVNSIARQSQNAAAAVGKLKAELPPDAELSSFETVDHLFLLLLGERVPRERWPESASEVDPELEYFCFDVRPDVPKRALPFEWEELARINCDRHRSANPECFVVVGRRLNDLQRAAARTPRIAAEPQDGRL